ncbi:aminomethyltransferase beta-barrel domain-containing protein [Candidatus Vidania fulgoroideorum]
MKILILLSGGVDSSYSSFFFKKLGFKVFCLYLNNSMKNEYNECFSKKDIDYCFYISNLLNLKFKIININKSFNLIIKKLLNRYKGGKSLNPDIFCNSEIKFKKIVNKFKKKFNLFSSGHYARIKRNSKHFLKQSFDKKKDQTYFLYNVDKKYIKKFIFPLGEYNKNEVLFICEYLNFKNSKKKSTKGICFLNNKNFSLYLKKFIKSKGIIKSKNGNDICEYKNLYYSAIGQRIKKSINNKKHYVYKKKKKNIYVVCGNNNLLYKRIFNIKNINFNKELCFLKAKTNSRNIKKKCIVYNKKIYFLYPIRLTTSGQSIVFYYKNICLGGGEVI